MRRDPTKSRNILQHLCYSYFTPKASCTCNALGPQQEIIGPGAGFEGSRFNLEIEGAQMVLG